MPENLFLCGLSPSQRAKYPDGKELRLHGTKPNLVLKIEDIRKRLSTTEPDLLTDLLELALYVFAADNLVSRGGRTFPNFGAGWRRSFHLVVAVREYGEWSEPGRLKALCDALHFLSDDYWMFTFVELHNPPSLQGYFDFFAGGSELTGDTSIVSFSGGVDSFAGAVHELTSSNRHVVLMSRRIKGITESRQSFLAKKLKEKYPKRVTHASVRAGLTNDTAAREHTQRTRSFLLTAIGMAAAYMERSRLIRFYENGIMSINLPISAQVVGTRASRSTHPRALLLLQQLAAQIIDDELTIDNPFIWKTKIEVLRELQNTPFGAFTTCSVSCSNTRHLAKHSQHCGVCAQCLQRQISEFGASACTAKPDLPYSTDLFLGPRPENEDRDMALDIIRSALEFCRLSDKAFATKYASELAWIVAGFPDINSDEIVRTFTDLFRRQGSAVNAVFVQATKDHAEELLHGRLSPDSLLRMVFSDATMQLDKSPIVAAVSPQRLPSEYSVADDRAASAMILVAVDNVRKRILIENIASIGGATEFRIISELVKVFREDRNSDRAPKNYRTMTDHALADALNANEALVRKTISRIRKKIKTEYQDLHQETLSLDHILENSHGKGYRINPSNVHVVDPSEIVKK